MIGCTIYRSSMEGAKNVKDNNYLSHRIIDIFLRIVKLKLLINSSFGGPVVPKSQANFMIVVLLFMKKLPVLRCYA